MTEYGKALSATATPIPGLAVFDLPVHGDARGWFKENWQRENMTASYSFLNLADETTAIDWPFPLDQVEISEKVKKHPRLAGVTPTGPKKILVTGANGQLGRALRAEFGEAGHIEYATREDLDLSHPGLATVRRWRDYGTIINAAAYTAVDLAETPEGRTDAWAANVTAVAALARIATDNGITLVHVSSDYVFDGTKRTPYNEADPIAPLSVYGQTKAAGDAIVSALPRHYIIRTSWAIGEGKNFVRTMASLAERGINPTVVNDQTGRLTFTSDIAAGIRHLLDNSAPSGTYNLTGSGEPESWADIARAVYQLTGHDPARITPVTTAQYFANATGPVAPRPANSILDLAKIESTGYVPRKWRESLRQHLATH